MMRYPDFVCLQLTSLASPLSMPHLVHRVPGSVDHPFHSALYIQVARMELQMQIPDCRTSGRLGTVLEGGTLGTINPLRSPRERRMHGMTSNVTKEENSAEDGSREIPRNQASKPQIIDQAIDFSSFENIRNIPFSSFHLHPATALCHGSFVCEKGSEGLDNGPSKFGPASSLPNVPYSTSGHVAMVSQSSNKPIGIFKEFSGKFGICKFSVLLSFV